MGIMDCFPQKMLQYFASSFALDEIEWYDVGCLPIYDEYLGFSIKQVGRFQLLC